LNSPARRQRPAIEQIHFRQFPATGRTLAIGGGIEGAFNQNWSVAGEYRYFGNRATTFDIPIGLRHLCNQNFERAAARRSGASQLPLQLRQRTGGGALLIVALSACTESADLMLRF
jgi:hypothetical protein